MLNTILLNLSMKAKREATGGDFLVFSRLIKNKEELQKNIWPKILIHRWKRDRNTANPECNVWIATESD